MSETQFEATLDRAAPSYSRDVGALYDRLQAFKKKWPGHKILSAKKEEGTKVHLVFIAAKSVEVPVSHAAPLVSRWNG